MTRTDLAVRTVMDTVEGADFKAQLKQALPPGLEIDKFVRTTLTALAQNPDVAKSEQQSLFNSIVRCAQDGLLPDGREAALVLFGGKVQYLPMVGGLRKRAAEYGFSLEAHAVYEHDNFSFRLGFEPYVHHVPPQDLRQPRGELAGAYAVATGPDGRKYLDVLTREDAELIRSSSRARNGDLWTKWTAEAYRKSAARRLFKQLPIGALDERTTRTLNAVDDEFDFRTAAQRALSGFTPPADPGPADDWEPAEGDVIGDGEESVASGGEQTGVPASDAQRKKLDVLVGQLRPAHISTEQLYAAVARSRDVSADALVGQVGGQDGDGLHWGPLRDALSKVEASDLIERLQRLQDNVEEREAA